MGDNGAWSSSPKSLQPRGILTARVIQLKQIPRHFSHRQSRTLNHIWCASDPMQINDSQRADWLYFKIGDGTAMGRTLCCSTQCCCSGPWLSVGILLSAAVGWVNRLFIPVYVKYGHPEAPVTIGPPPSAKANPLPHSHSSPNHSIPPPPLTHRKPHLNHSQPIHLLHRHHPLSHSPTNRLPIPRHKTPPI